MKKTPLFAALALCFAASGAMAQEPVQPHPDKAAKRAAMEARMKEKLAQTDTNKDGKIDRSEYLAESEARFTKMDANSDGAITDNERKAAHEKRRMEWKEKHGDKGFNKVP